MPNQNPDIVSLYNSLCDQQDVLHDEMQSITDPKLADVISTEIGEIAHRLLLTQDLLFKQNSAQLAANVKAVGASSQDLAKAIANLSDTTTFINSVSAYLTTVDQAIDLAKTLAAAA